MTYRQLQEIHLSPSDFERYEMSMEERIALKILYSLWARDGFEVWWSECKEDAKEEIFEEIRDIISRGGRVK